MSCFQVIDVGCSYFEIYFISKIRADFLFASNLAHYIGLENFVSSIECNFALYL